MSKRPRLVTKRTDDGMVLGQAVIVVTYTSDKVLTLRSFHYPKGKHNKVARDWCDNLLLLAKGVYNNRDALAAAADAADAKTATPPTGANP